MLSLSHKDHLAKKIFQEQCTIQRETCRFFILSSHSPQNEKGFYSLRLRSLSRSYRLSAKSRGVMWRKGEEGESFQADPRDTPSNQEPISGGNYCVLGHLNANLVTLHSLVYNASKRGWDPFIGILFVKRVSPFSKGSPHSCTCYVLPSFKNAPCIQKRVPWYVCRIDGILPRAGLCDFILRLIGYSTYTINVHQWNCTSRSRVWKLETHRSHSIYLFISIRKSQYTFFELLEFRLILD